MQFEDWMKAEGLSDSSVKKYVEALDGSLSAWAKAHGLATGPLRSIHDVQQFSKVSKDLETTPEYALRNTRGHHMYGAALKKYSAFLTSRSSLLPSEPGPHGSKLIELEGLQATAEPYNPEGQTDGRDKVLREIVRRRGQRKFRLGLIHAYGAKCAISGCSVLPILEAAHITPYLGPDTNAISNGLLLRADLHTLWDLQLIAVDPNTMKLWVSTDISDPTYESLAGRDLFQTADPSNRPSPKALSQQWESAKSKL